MQKQSGKFSHGTARGDDIIHNRDMEAVDRQFKAKGVFQVPFARPGVEPVLNGSGMSTFQRRGWVPATQPVGERTAQQVALIVSPPPVPTLKQWHVHKRVDRRQPARSSRL
ncbi:hypothetical protein FJMB80151_44530 [Enterobacter hormaechei]|nr:hypothetical protein FJMB80063_43710 [Enterobacter hormaechei]GJL03359.1 hypothetical protein TUM17570_23680 [Enterobacter cloacae]BDK32745.1 hypothetical protein FJMB80068_43090 [Enterobacter hormaechei]BDK37945.1 hypothetical protein FJMB80144_44560 [Enterobacter hormaechei]BDK43142.1 hypothetical protein FJMB80145_44550 [Enterobacter hormaechei]